MLIRNQVINSLVNKSGFAKILGTTTLLLTLTGMGSNANAATFNWNNVGWSTSTASGTTFNNVDSSGIDITVEYSDNMWDGTPGIYSAHPLGDTYEGTLRFTNDTSRPLENTWVKLTFSEAVYIDETWVGSLSTLSNNRKEWVSLSAYSGTSVDSGSLVAASKYDTYENFFGNRFGSATSGVYNANADTPSLIGLDPNIGDKVYTTQGIGSQGNNRPTDKFGRVFFEYADNAVQTLYIEHFVTNLDSNPSPEDSRSTGLASVAIGQNIVFQQAATVPEPSSILGLVAVSGSIAGSWLVRKVTRNK
ncbi:MAG: PEP-CTERM sorting domain-containing protein [Nostocaceae cyanobacterium]|nr:PEP-CTERM sorting domain-containing protein [Nostocaceae cyanobacterium]